MTTAATNSTKIAGNTRGPGSRQPSNIGRHPPRLVEGEVAVLQQVLHPLQRQEGGMALVHVEDAGLDVQRLQRPHIEREGHGVGPVRRPDRRQGHEIGIERRDVGVA